MSSGVLIDKEVKKFVESPTRTNATAVEVVAVSITKDEAVLIDNKSVTKITYIGTAAIGSSQAAAVWKIKRLDETGTVSVVTYADSNANYDNVWNNRLTLTYG